MNLDLSLVLLLLLPGFLSLWIYKQGTIEDLDRRGEWTQAVLGLCFGVANIFVYILFFEGVIKTYFGISSIPNISENDGLAALITSGVLSRYLLLILISLFVGTFTSLLEGRGGLPTHFLAVFVSRILVRPLRRRNESAIGALIVDMQPNYESIVRIYQLGNSEKALVGTYGGFSENEQQILLQDECLFRQSIYRNGEYWKTFRENNPTRSCISLKTGIVVEFLDINKLDQAGYRAWLNDQREQGRNN